MVKENPQEGQEGKEEINLSIPSLPKYLPLLRGVLDCVLKGLGISDKESIRIKLALDEATTNIIRHSCGTCVDVKIDITFRITPEELIIEVRDFGDKGKDFDFNEERTKDLDNVTPGGFGVNIIKTVMDTVEYSTCPVNGNILRMQKKIK